MSKTTIIKPYADTKDVMVQMEKMSVTGAYETVKSNNSSIDDLYAHVLEYISYLFVKCLLYLP